MIACFSDRHTCFCLGVVDDGYVFAGVVVYEHLKCGEGRCDCYCCEDGCGV